MDKLKRFGIGIWIFILFCIDPFLYIEQSEYCKSINSSVWKEWKKFVIG